MTGFNDIYTLKRKKDESFMKFNSVDTEFKAIVQHRRDHSHKQTRQPKKKKKTRYRLFLPQQ